MTTIFKKLAYVLDKLSLRPKIGGLQMSDSALQYVLLEKGKPVTFSLRLPPGVVKEGKIEAPDQFLTLLRQLHQLASSGNVNKKLKVIVSLPSAVIYTQSFSVPKVGQEKLEEAAQLNLQVLSPISIEKAYVSWQVIGETEDRYELLGAFIEKAFVDNLKGLLEVANFTGIIFEFPALALARVVSSSVSLPPEPVLVLQISSDGLDIIILKEGVLHFEYFRSWRSIQGESRAISKSVFEEVVVHEIKKVVNFSLSRFKENVDKAFVVAPGFEEEIKQLLESRFGLKAATLSLKQYVLAPNWYAALGSAMRGALDRSRDTQINLSGTSLAKELYKEYVLGFARVWKNVVIGMMLVFLGAFGMSAVILVKQSNILSDRLISFSAQISQDELLDLKQNVSEFNYLVGVAGNVKRESRSLHQILVRIKQLADDNFIVLDGLSIGSRSESVDFVGRAPSASQVITFKNVLVENSDFLDVDLPLSKIRTLEDNSVGFSLSFRVE